MSTVYRAAHATLGRSAAVKMLLPVLPNHHEMVDRLFNEARSATSIRHPGIVEVYDIGVLPDRTAYIMMEFLEGENLAERLRRERRIPFAHALEIVRAIARTLHAAHGQGVVHCDLKPENIFLVPDPELPSGQRIKLLDFGIARLGVDRERGPTRTGIVMGTPPYMSPEQCRSDSIDHRSDLYALGCVLYELLCGRPPFVGNAALQVIAHHLYFAPLPPREHDDRIPPALEALVLWMLQKDPRHRPATAAHVVAAIDDLDLSERVATSARSSDVLRAPLDTMPMMTPPDTAPVATSFRHRTCPHRTGTYHRGCDRSARRTT